MHQQKKSGSGIFGMVTGAVGAAGAIVAAHTPAVIANRLPGHTTTSKLTPETTSINTPNIHVIK